MRTASHSFTRNTPAQATQLLRELDHRARIRMEFASFDDFWAPYLGKQGPSAEYVGSLNAEALGRLQDAVRRAYLDGEPDGRRSHAAIAWAVRGTKPT
jgi:hypothetical protein